MATKKNVHKSNAPIYAIALTWLIFWLLMDVMLLEGILEAALLCAIVGLVVKLMSKNKGVKAVTEESKKEETKTKEEKKEEPEKEESTGNKDLDKMIQEGRLAIKEMKRLDDNIEDETISEQIVRLETLSQKIFDHVKEKPEKLPQIRKFMNYYLPTTLKILNAYDRMGEAGVEGQNIAGAMERVEGIMKTIIKAFEKQLDSLYGSDAMDLTSEISAMETMMAREGLIEDGLHQQANN